MTIQQLSDIRPVCLETFIDLLNEGWAACTAPTATYLYSNFELSDIVRLSEVDVESPASNPDAYYAVKEWEIGEIEGWLVLFHLRGQSRRCGRCGKIDYKTRFCAQRHLDAIKHKEKDKSKVIPQRVYKCGCGSFLLTSEKEPKHEFELPFPKRRHLPNDTRETER
jgi:hypothetical protein